MDASCFCTAPLETWVKDLSKVTLFSVRQNPDIYENWAIASPMMRHPTIKLWLDELAAAHASTKPGTSPLAYIDAALRIHSVRQRWKPNTAQASSLPYLWCHLALQVALHKHPEAHETLCVLDSLDGPMHRRSKYAPLENFELGNAIASDLASFPLGHHDRYFIKFVGHDRGAIGARLAARNLPRGSALDCISLVYPRPISFGQPVAASLCAIPLALASKSDLDLLEAAKSDVDDLQAANLFWHLLLSSRSRSVVAPQAASPSAPPSPTGPSPRLPSPSPSAPPSASSGDGASPSVTTHPPQKRKKQKASNES